MDLMTDQPSLFDPVLWKEDLFKLLRRGVGSLDHGGSTTTTEVGDCIVVPVLRHLGWDVDDDEQVVRGHETTAGAVDFVLCDTSREPAVLIKIGALPAVTNKATTHPFEDRTIRAIHLAVSEDGHVWRFHLAAGRGTIRNREFECVHVDTETDVVAEAFERYLAFQAVKSGAALRLAEQDYGRKRFPAEAHGAWHRSLLGRELLHRFLREVEEAIGVAPDPEQAEEFVSRQCGSASWPPDPPEAKPARRVAMGDRVWVYDFALREIVTHTVVGGDPDCERGEVSCGSAVGFALLGAREGEERELRLPDKAPRPIRIVLIGTRVSRNDVGSRTYSSERAGAG